MDRPWMAALEMQFAAARFAETVLQAKHPAVERHGTGLYHLAAASIPRAETYTWSHDVLSALFLAGRTIPRDAALNVELLPASVFSWWWFEESLPFHSNRGAFGEAEVAIHAVLLQSGITRRESSEPALGITTFGVLENRAPFPTTHINWAYGETLAQLEQRYEAHYVLENGDTDQTACHARRLSVVVLAALVWLQQRILSWSAGHVERHRRKQLAREHNAPLPSDVRVIQLRRAESVSRPPSAGGESVEWSCRWIVNGHWRNQPYKDERKLIYIMPYVKGPEEMPLRVPTHTVYQVSR